MIQKTYYIKEYNPKKLEAILSEVRGLPAYETASQVLLLLLEQNWDEEAIKAKTEMIRSSMPKAEIAGVTHYDHVAYEMPDNNTVLTFLFFCHSSFMIRSLDMDGQSDAEVGQGVKHMLQSCDCPKCLLTFFAGEPRNIEQILDTAEEENPDILIFGATAGVMNFFSRYQGTGYVFDSENVYRDTLIAVLFYGDDLHVKASYNFGWTRVGKPMRITKLKDPYTVAEIDHRPAAEVYEKYLGIPWKNGELIVENICEFPLTVTRSALPEMDGKEDFSMADSFHSDAFTVKEAGSPHIHMGRIPYAWTPGGDLNFAIAMHEGEQLRLSYGFPQQIFTQICENADEFRLFSPQAMLMSVCMNRVIFLGEHEHLETDAFKSIAPNAVFFHGNSEIFRSGGVGGEMHSALIAVGFREGEKRDILPEPDCSKDMEMPERQIIPLEFRLMTFLRAVTSDLEQATDELLHLKKHLEDEVERKTRENESLELHVVQTLAEAIDAKDTYTNGHSSRVAAYSMEIAKRAGYTRKDQNEIYMMGLLHDVGKIGVPDAVINKPGKLTDEEFEKIKNHPVMGARILKNIREMPKLVTGARWHHERFDGKGYPDGLKGYDIPEEARIIAVADAYDAMTSNRSYRRGMEQSTVREQIVKGRGTQFDPKFADIMLTMIDEDTEYRMRE